MTLLESGCRLEIGLSLGTGGLSVAVPGSPCSSSTVPQTSSIQMQWEHMLYTLKLVSFSLI